MFFKLVFQSVAVSGLVKNIAASNCIQIFSSHLQAEVVNTATGMEEYARLDFNF